MALLVTNILPAEAYGRIKRAGINAKVNMEALSTKAAAGSVTGREIRDVYILVRNVLAQWAVDKAVPGIVAFAQDQEDDPTYDPVAEFTATEAALGGVLTWVANNIPTDGSGFAAVEQWGTDGTITDRTFAPAATAGLRTELNAAAATLS